MLKNAFYIALFALISWGGYQLSYPSNTPADLFYEGIFMENIIQHVDKMTQGPRAVGDYYHDDVQRYLINQLNTMGFKVSQQKSTAIEPERLSAAPIRNIIAKKSGSDPNSQDLLLLAHYDTAKFSGTGAGDDASGVAVILETVNAFIKTKQPHSRDIIVLFTDAEEVGLLGAHAFINEQLKNHDIGLIINLEARGSDGPVMMWPETIGGNRAMIEGFAAAEVPMPVTTSLHYEVYKMLPNDTDLTPFNQLGKINGFNLAFMDDHFNYHTQLDTLKNLSLNTLAHQAIQLNSLLKYFSNVDLTQMKSTDSLVYFSLPMIGLVSYPVWLTWFLLAISGVLLICQAWVINRRQAVNFKPWLEACIPIFLASVLAYGWCWLLLLIINTLFPTNLDIMQGFPYQGHAIMAALLIGSAIIGMSVIGWFNRQNALNQLPQSTVHIFLWLVLLIPVIYFMPGTGLLLLPVVLAILLLTLNNYVPKMAEQLAPVLAALSFVLLGGLIVNLPVALGVSALPLTAVFLVWLLALFVPVISPIKKAFHALLLLVLPLGYLAFALFSEPSVSRSHPHPTSLSYLYDADTQKGYYYNYDVSQSGWTEHLFDAKSSTMDSRKDFSKQYHQPVRHLVEVTPAIKIKAIEIQAKKPLQQGKNQIIELNIKAKSETEILEIFTQQNITIHKLSIEGRNAVLSEPIKLRANQRLLQYYFNGDKQLNLRLEINYGERLEWQVQSHELDLLKRSEFNLPSRPEHQIQKPFIKSDNTVVVQSFAFGLDQ